MRFHRIVMLGLLAGCAGTGVPETDWIARGDELHAGGDGEAAIEAWQRATEPPSSRADAWFRIACAHAAAGRVEPAIAAFDSAKRAGFGDRAAAESTPDLAILGGDERFVLPVDRHIHVVHLEDGTPLTIGVRSPADSHPIFPHPFLLVPGDPKPDDPVRDVLWGEAAVQRGWIVIESAAFDTEDPGGITGLLMDDLLSRWHVEDGKFALAARGESTAGMLRAAVELAPRLRAVTAIGGVVPEDVEQNLQWIRVPVVWYGDGSDDSRAARERLTGAGVEVVYRERIDPDELRGGVFMDALDALRAP